MGAQDHVEQVGPEESVPTSFVAVQERGGEGPARVVDQDRRTAQSFCGLGEGGLYLVGFPYVEDLAKSVDLVAGCPSRIGILLPDSHPGTEVGQRPCDPSSNPCSAARYYGHPAVEAQRVG